MGLIFRFLSVAWLCLCLTSCSENASFNSDIQLVNRKAPNMTAKLYFQNGSSTTISLINFYAQSIDEQSFLFINTTNNSAVTYTVIRVDVVEPDAALETTINGNLYVNKSGLVILPKTTASIETKVSPDDVIYTSPNIVGEENDEL